MYWEPEQALQALQALQAFQAFQAFQDVRFVDVLQRTHSYRDSFRSE